MKYRTLFIVFILLQFQLFSQQTSIFNVPPGNITLPSILEDEKSTPKSTGIAILESKWVQSTNPNTESLLQLFSNSQSDGIHKIIYDVLAKANIPPEKSGRLNINFTSTGTDEKVISINDAAYSDDFASKFTKDNLFIVDKLYRTNKAVIEITESGTVEFSQEISSALSEGLRFGNKTETIQDNKMIIEIQNLVYAYEYQPLIIERLTDQELVIPLYYNIDVGINSISSMIVTEGLQGDYYTKIISDKITKPIEFRISASSPSYSFRLGGKESYILKFIQMSGNKVTFSISGFCIKYQ